MSDGDPTSVVFVFLGDEVGPSQTWSLDCACASLVLVLPGAGVNGVGAEAGAELALQEGREGPGGGGDGDAKGQKRCEKAGGVAVSVAG